MRRVLSPTELPRRGPAMLARVSGRSALGVGSRHSVLGSISISPFLGFQFSVQVGAFQRPARLSAFGVWLWALGSGPSARWGLRHGLQHMMPTLLGAHGVVVLRRRGGHEARS